ncbi:hypothetical protein KI743_21590 [Vibrio sp. D420a]|jgi:nitrogen regulatory protein PII|uniref:P-II family nitrogen regulator n=1 Tax=Vibrio TaxID=662 RepID=UPI0012681F8F|nr:MULTISPECIES: P-II family nitrogen regulator [unclassified Vibrio]MDK9764598.1 hypothetical protein [Vibrio sp. D420a]QFT13339.1 hypothetical protein FIV04_25650 [Vibrio sp. THAF190c]
MIDKVSVIFQEHRLEEIESILMDEGVRKFTIYPVQGRGTQANLIDTHVLSSYYKLDVFIGQNYTGRLTEILLNTVSVSQEGNGVTSVERNVLVYDNNTKQQISLSSYNHKP